MEIKTSIDCGDITAHFDISCTERAVKYMFLYLPRKKSLYVFSYGQDFNQTQILTHAISQYKIDPYDEMVISGGWIKEVGGKYNFIVRAKNMAIDC